MAQKRLGTAVVGRWRGGGEGSWRPPARAPLLSRGRRACTSAYLPGRHLVFLVEHIHVCVCASEHDNTRKDLPPD